jgi:hypothetical protein
VHFFTSTNGKIAPIKKLAGKFVTNRQVLFIKLRINFFCCEIISLAECFHSADIGTCELADFAGIERMALGADFDSQILSGGKCFKLTAT